jgi:hypothetical protein
MSQEAHEITNLGASHEASHQNPHQISPPPEVPPDTLQRSLRKWGRRCLAKMSYLDFRQASRP